MKNFSVDVYSTERVMTRISLRWPETLGDPSDDAVLSALRSGRVRPEHVLERKILNDTVSMDRVEVFGHEAE